MPEPPNIGPAKDRLAKARSAVAAVIARMLHRAQEVELERLGVDTGKVVRWNVSRPDIQRRALEAADELFGQILETAGGRVKSAIADELGKEKDPQQIAAELRKRYEGVSKRQAQAVMRTVTRRLYNEAALDAYEAAGVTHVTASDGHGGLTGKTDPGCLARNGKRYTIAQARAEEHSPTSHPNCTLSFAPEVPDAGLDPDREVTLPPVEPDLAAMLTDGIDELMLAMWSGEAHPRRVGGAPGKRGGRFMRKGLRHASDLTPGDHFRVTEGHFEHRGMDRSGRVLAIRHAPGESSHGERRLFNPARLVRPLRAPGSS